VHRHGVSTQHVSTVPRGVSSRPSRVSLRGTHDEWVDVGKIMDAT
jgi:hypothetical protein